MLCLTAVIVSSNDSIIGFQFYDLDNRAVSYKTMDETKKFLQKHQVRDLSLNNGQIIPSIPLDRLAHIYKNEVRNNVNVVLFGGREGYSIFSPKEAVEAPLGDAVATLRYKLSEEDLKILQSGKGSLNLNFANGVGRVTPDGEIIITGNFNTVKRKVFSEAEKQAAREKASLRARQSLFSRPLMRAVPVADSHMHDVDEASEMTVEQKIAYMIIALRDTSPFLFGMMKGITILEAQPGLGLDTMGVSVNNMYFNSEFVRKTPLDELTFIVIHEMYHMLFKHPARGENKVQRLYNIACDLYVNKAIAVDYHLRFVNGEVNQLSSNGGRTYKIRVPNTCLYNGNIDLDKNTPEEIYNQLYKKVQDKMKQGGNKNKKGNSQGQGQGSGQGRGQGSDQDKDKQNQNGGGQGNEQMTPEEAFEKAVNELVDELTKGNKDATGDIVTNNEERGKSKEQLAREANSLLQRAQTIAKKRGYSLNGSSVAERFVIKENGPKINWKTVLKNKMTKATQTRTSFSSPDRRFLSRNKIYPGPKKAEPDSLGEIIIGIDTSGSIGDKELGIAFSQIEQLLRQYKATGTLFWWDTRCSKPFEFKNFQDLLRSKPTGGGGTDPNCLFETIDRMLKKNRSMEPTAILIFTDGYFGEVDKKWAKYRDTIWIIFKEDLDRFEAPFGVIAPFKLEDS